MNLPTRSIPQIRTRRPGLRLPDEWLLALEVGIVFAATLRYFVFTVALTWPYTPLLSDFVAFWTGASLLRDGAGPALFDMARQRATEVALLAQLAPPDVVASVTGHNPYHNPPPLALVFVPLTLLPFLWAYVLWFAINLAVFVASVSVLLRGSSRARSKALVLLAFGGVAFSLREGQVNSLFLLSFSLALVAFRRDKPVAGGALLGFLWLKPQYAAPFALVLLFKRRWRELFGMLGVGAGIAALSLAMVGLDGALDYLKEMQRIGAFRPPVEAFVRPDAMVNWRALLLNLWPEIPDAAGNVLVLLLAAATVLVALLAWRGPWIPSSPRFAEQMLVLAIAAIVASPHSHLHGAVLLLAPTAVLLANWTDDAAPVRGWRTLLVGGLMLSVAVLPFPQQRWGMVPYLLAGLGILLVERRVKPVVTSLH